MIGAFLLAMVQGVAGDTSAFAHDVTTRDPYQVRLELQRPAYVTVLRVRPDGVELASSQGFRLHAGTRYVHLAPSQSFTTPVAFEPGMTPLDIRRECAYSRPTPARPRFAVVRRAEYCGNPEVSFWEPQRRYIPAPSRPHQLLTIVSATPLDLAALSVARDGIAQPVTDLGAFTATLLAGHAGAWAAYVTRVD